VKKFLLAYILISLLVSGWMASPVLAEADEFANPFVPVSIRQIDGSLIKTNRNGYIGKHEVLVPLSVVADNLTRDYSIERRNAGLYFMIDRPRFELETPRLTEYIKDGVDLQLNTTNVMGVTYINLKGLEKFLNISIEQARRGEQLIVRKLAKSNTKLNDVRTPFKPKGKISLVWDHVLGEPANLDREEKIPGLTVISPTWFAVTDGRGTVANKADWKYVKDAHEKGYKVWPLLSNSFDPDMTRIFLADVSAQDRAVRQLLMLTSLYDLDGINIDFENVYDDDKDRLTAFVSRLTGRLKQQGMVISIDATVPSGVPMWSNCYDRAALGKIVDYFMVMTYDEHWRTSPVAGSVASIGWVEQGIVNTLQYVPKEKLLMGIPFYTREWRESAVGYGKPQVRSKTMWMADVESRILQYKLTPRWLEKEGQYYIEYNDENYRYRVWIEEAKSIGLKVALANKYDLAGVAAWRKGFEKEGIWKAIQIALGQPSIPAKTDPYAEELSKWSLKSFMERAKGAEQKGSSQ